jgi:hypothetical protein
VAESSFSRITVATVPIRKTTIPDDPCIERAHAAGSALPNKRLKLTARVD